MKQTEEKALYQYGFKVFRIDLSVLLGGEKGVAECATLGRGIFFIIVFIYIRIPILLRIQTGVS